MITLSLGRRWFLLVLTAGLLLARPVAQAAPPLVIYSATDQIAFEPLLEAYQKRRPDVRVVYREFNTLELYQTILQHKGDRSFEADVVISSSMDLQTALVNQGIAHRFLSPYADSLPDWAQWRHEIYGFTYEPTLVIYNKQAFAHQNLPDSHADLAALIRDNPSFYNGRIATYDVRQSGIGYLFATQDEIQGPQAARLIESFGRAQAKLFCCTAQMFSQVASGDLVLAYNVIGSYALEAAAQDPRVGVHFLTDYTLIMARSALVLKTAHNPEAAVDLVNFLLSPEGQTVMAEQSALIPIIHPERHHSQALGLLRNGQRAVFAIRFGTGLLTYLDRMKRYNFLTNWEGSLRPPVAP
jgi:ABC-type Fe3+ transport system substrate-binding protein